MNDEDNVEPREIGRIAYEAAAAATGVDQVWGWQRANKTKWDAAAKAVLAWACNELDEEAKYGCPCNEDDRVAWELKLALSALIDADHLADCAERLLAALNRKAGAIERVEVADMGGIGAPERAAMELEKANETVSEFWRGVQGAAYEYRKRAERARAALKWPNAGVTGAELARRPR